MPDAIIFSDAHIGENDPEATERLLEFLRERCARVPRLYILGDLFNFWFGPSQARMRPYRDVLEAIREVAATGTEVTFYHGNRDFYLHEETARRFRMRLVRDFSIEEICRRRVLMCHGDELCVNDLSYHKMKRVLRHPLVERAARLLPAFLVKRFAHLLRVHSRRVVSGKSQRVLGIDEAALRRHFSQGVDAIICGHTHIEGRASYETPDGARTLFTLGDFGARGSYLECSGADWVFRRAGGAGGAGGKAASPTEKGHSAKALTREPPGGSA